MGAGIAQVVAASGRRVSLYDAQPGATDRALAGMRKSLGKLAEKGGPPADDVLARVSVVDELVPADLMIEAVVEDAEVKEDIFRRADGVLPADAVLASNTSSIPIGSLAAATGRPQQVIGMHFFNPVPVLKLVEIIRGRDTSDETAQAITELAVDLGKTPAVANDFPGFVSNRILMPFINEAVWALHDGVAEAEAIDTIAEARLRPSARPAGARRPDRSRHLRRDHGGASRRIGRRSLRSVPLARGARFGRKARPQERRRFLRILVRSHKKGGVCRVSPKDESLCLEAQVGRELCRQLHTEFWEREARAFADPAGRRRSCSSDPVEDDVRACRRRRR